MLNEIMLHNSHAVPSPDILIKAIYVSFTPLLTSLPLYLDMFVRTHEMKSLYNDKIPHLTLPSHLLNCLALLIVSRDTRVL